jgi:undecaprenyl-diphosphatase
MDWLRHFHAFILGIVEGATEFLPVSSTGHLIIVGDLLGFNNDKGKVFEILIQLGAILAVCWVYRRKLIDSLMTIQSRSKSLQFFVNLAVAFIPSAVLGFFFAGAIKTHLFNPISVAIALILGAFVIFWVERPRAAGTGAHSTDPTGREARVHEVDDMSARDALMVGLAQCVSLWPGTSRAGATIIGGMLAGLSRKTATEFSFFLAIPTMFAATFYDVFKNRALFSADDVSVFATGFVVSFIAALIAVKALIRFVSNHTFRGFAWYRIVLGVVVLWYFWN